jgi:hypothetical protein
MMFQNLKINSHIVLVLCLFFFNCNQNNSCEFLDDNNQLLKPIVLKKFEDDVQRVFKNAEIEVAINAFLINEELDSISKNHYTANLISNYSNKSMSQYSSAFLEIYCDSIARIRSKPVSRFEFEELYNQSVD